MRWTLPVVGVILLALVGQAGAQQFPDGPGKEILENQCGVCHGPEQVVAGGGRSLEEWKEVIQEMVEMGAEITREQSQILAEYLAKNWPAKKEEPAPAASSRAQTLCPACVRVN
jgi:mono/diheme cytochrome c family protein